MKKIKLISLVSAVILALTACTGKETMKSADEISTVTVWSCNSHSKTVYEKLVNDWNSSEGKKKGIFIDYQVKGGDSMTQALELALQNGDAPDFFEGDVPKLAENGYILPIDELPGGEEIIKKYEGKLYKDSNTHNGKTYSIPIGAGTQGLLYNKDMFKAAGIVDENGEAKPPQTFDEMVECASKLTNVNEKKYGIIFPMKWNGWFSSDVSSLTYSAAGFNEYNPVTDEYDCSAYVAIMNAIMAMKEQGSVYPGAESLDNDTARAQFAAGNVAMKFGFSFDVGVLNDQFPATCDWGVAPYPVIDVNHKYKQRMEYSPSMLINAQSVETIGKEKLLEVFKFFISDELVKERYIQGVGLPYDWELVKDIELGDDTKKGWKEFAELVSISERFHDSPKRKMSGKKGISARFVEEVWAGKKSPEAMCEEYTKDITAGREQYYKEHPDMDPKGAYNPDWDIRR